MAASTISVTPAGMGGGGGGDPFKKIGGLLKSAQKRAIQGRDAADSEIDRLNAKIESDKESGEGVDQADVEQLKYLKGRREQKGYFFKQALGFSATDRLKTTLGKFQRDPAIENDPAASEKERFFAKTGITRPDMLPDTSNREAGGDMMSYIGQGFQAITDAINRVGKKLKSVSASTASVASTVNKTVNSTETLGKSTEDLADVSKVETDLKQKELDNYKDAQEDAQVEAEASSRRGILDVARSINVKEVGLGAAKGIGGRLLGGLGSIGGKFLKRRGRRGRTAYPGEIGPLPMNSREPWAKAGPGEMGNSAGFVPRLSQGGIIQPKMLTNPTKISSKSFAAIPTERPEGKKLLSGTKRDSDNMGKMFALGPIISGGMTFATMGMLANANPLIGAVLNTARPVLEPIAEAFGFPPSILNVLLGRKPSGDAKENERPQRPPRPRPPGPPPGPPRNDPTSEDLPFSPSPDATQVEKIKEQKLSSQDIKQNFGMKTNDTFNFSIPGGGNYKAYKTTNGFEIFRYGGLGSLFGRDQRIDTSGGKNARVVQALIEEGNRRVGRQSSANPLVPTNSGIKLKRSQGSQETGSGFSPVGLQDRNRRPLVFSQPAGNAFVKMYNDANGAIKGSDITSTKRSQRKNDTVGGAAGSLHLRGMAMDVQGDSQTWIKQHGSKYGWVYAPYPGQQHEGHFIYDPKLRSSSETQTQTNARIAPTPTGKSLPGSISPSETIAMAPPIAKPVGTPTITGDSSSYPVSSNKLNILFNPAFT